MFRWNLTENSSAQLSIISTLSTSVSPNFVCVLWTLGLHSINREISEPSSNVSAVEPLVLGRRKWHSRPVVRLKHPITPSGTTAWANTSIFMISGHTAIPRYPILVISPMAEHLQNTKPSFWSLLKSNDFVNITNVYEIIHIQNESLSHKQYIACVANVVTVEGYRH